jgi:hypothetical protein
MFGYNTTMHSGAALYGGRFFHERYTQSAFIGLTINVVLAVQLTGKIFFYIGVQGKY